MCGIYRRDDESERGKGNPALQFLLKITGALGTEMNDLFVAPAAQEEKTEFILSEINSLIRKLDEARIVKLRKILRIIAEQR
jgi:transcriptional regulator with XRE-family HTH domain